MLWRIYGNRALLYPLDDMLGPKDAVAFGAVRVKELSQTDWQLLPSWKELRPLEQRRLRAAVVAQ